LFLNSGIEKESMPHEIVTVEWEGRPVDAFFPAPLSELDDLKTPTLLAAARAEGVLAATPLHQDSRLEVAARLLLRAEGVASSRIEAINAPVELVVVADVDPTIPGPAAEVADNLRALDEAHTHEGALTCDDLLRWHRILTQSAPLDDALKGAWRDRLGWVGGSTPHRAAHVATPHDRINSAMIDLVEFANMSRFDAVTTAALLHAQFETIHPFADGNGRLGRLLIGWTLRRRGRVSVPPPISVAFLRDVGGYLAGLTLYRTAGPDEWVRWFAGTVEDAATSAARVLTDVSTLIASWPNRLSDLRSDAAAHRLLDHVVTHPALDVTTTAGLLDVSRPTARAALETLTGRNVLRAADLPRTGEPGRPRSWWVTGELLDLLVR
jgi:Fic family protein